MAKNDYRRQLIMLRGLEKGYTGHARLEKRVLTGSMDFITSANQADVLEAAFVGSRGGKMRVQTLGRLKDAPRGQKALLANFDPRNIAGMDLGEVQAAVISRIGNGYKTPVMYGCINGVCALDWTGITDALNEGAKDAGNAQNMNVQSEDEPIQQQISEGSEAEMEIPLQEGNAPAIPDTENSNETRQDSGRKSAASLLDLDISVPWPDDIESLRLLFMTLPAYEPFEMDGYVFIRAKMAEETNIDHCAVGVRAENGKVTGVCYALPMPYTSEPPAGLEDYMWIGDTQSGWWVTCEDMD